MDRIVNVCLEYSIYANLDLHAVPGDQTWDRHSDSDFNMAPDHMLLLDKSAYAMDFLAFYRKKRSCHIRYIAVTISK